MAPGVYPAIRSNSLPSISAKVVQRDLSRWTSRSLWAPRLSRRSVSASRTMTPQEEDGEPAAGPRIRHEPGSARGELDGGVEDHQPGHHEPEHHVELWLISGAVIGLTSSWIAAAGAVGLAPAHRGSHVIQKAGPVGGPGGSHRSGCCDSAGSGLRTCPSGSPHFRGPS